MDFKRISEAGQTKNVRVQIKRRLARKAWVRSHRVAWEGLGCVLIIIGMLLVLTRLLSSLLHGKERIDPKQVFFVCFSYVIT